MAVVVTRDRERLIKLWTTPADCKQLLLFTAFGLLDVYKRQGLYPKSKPPLLGVVLI